MHLQTQTCYKILDLPFTSYEVTRAHTTQVMILATASHTGTGQRLPMARGGEPVLAPWVVLLSLFTSRGFNCLKFLVPNTFPVEAFISSPWTLRFPQQNVFP